MVPKGGTGAGSKEPWKVAPEKGQKESIEPRSAGEKAPFAPKRKKDRIRKLGSSTKKGAAKKVKSNGSPKRLTKRRNQWCTRAWGEDPLSMKEKKKQVNKPGVGPGPKRMGKMQPNQKKGENYKNKNVSVVL